MVKRMVEHSVCSLVGQKEKRRKGVLGPLPFSVNKGRTERNMRVSTVVVEKGQQSPRESWGKILRGCRS